MYSIFTNRPLPTAPGTTSAIAPIAVAPSGTASAAGIWSIPPRRSNAGSPSVPSPLAEFNILADDMRWVDEALGAGPTAVAHQASPLRRGGSSLPLAHAVPSRFMMAAQDLGDEVRAGQSASGTAARRTASLPSPSSTPATTAASGDAANTATPPTQHSIKRASQARKNRLQNRAHREDRMRGGIVPSYTYSKRVSRETTDRLNRYKDQLDALGADKLLTLRANFTLDDLRALLHENGMVLETELRDASAMEGAHNFIFHAVCERGDYERKATVDEVADHVASIVTNQTKIASCLDITRSLQATQGLTSSYEAVKRAIRPHPSLKDLPVYA